MPAGSGKKAAMGIFTLSMLNIAAVLSIVNFPEQAYRFLHHRLRAVFLHADRAGVGGTGFGMAEGRRRLSVGT